MLKFTALIVNKGVALSQIGMVFLSIIPPFLEIALPMSALLGVMLALARLSGDSEIIVLRASGISLYNILIPVIVFGIFVSILNFYVSLDLRPWGFRSLQKTLFDIARTRTTSGLDSGVFNKLGKLTVYADRIDSGSGEMKNVVIDDRREMDSRHVIIGKSGVISSDDAAQAITITLTDGSIHDNREGNYDVTHFVTNAIVLKADDLIPTDDKSNAPRTEERPLFELNESIIGIKDAINKISDGADPDQFAERYSLPKPVTLKDIKKKLNRMTIESGRRFSMPIAPIVLALVAFSLGIQPPRVQRTWGAGASAALGLFVFVVYYGILSVGFAFAESGKIPSYLALWLPNIIAFVFGVYLARKVSSEKWQSIADGLERIFFLRRKSA